MMTIEQKAKVFDWMFNKSKTFVVVHRGDKAMNLLCHGMYIESCGRKLYSKEPGLIKFYAQHLRTDGWKDIFIVDDLHDANSMKAYWIDVMVSHSKKGHDVMLDDKVLLPAYVTEEFLLIQSDLHDSCNV